VPDSEAEEQTVATELERLLTLKAYLVLDAAKEEAFDKLTQEARVLYNVPTSLISLVDLGRQFLLSNTGNPGDVRETARTAALCSHTILSKSGVCVVRDASKDPRFCENDLVRKDPPRLRFYAGAPLISPEGYKLGTFCVEGPEPRPEGLSEEEKAKLREFAARAMALMVQRREKLQQQGKELNAPNRKQWRKHAAVCTNLGGILFCHDKCFTAMRLFQESVQTLMHVEQEETSIQLSSLERQEEMAQLMTLLSAESLTCDSRKALIKKAVALYEKNVPIGAEPKGSQEQQRHAHSDPRDSIPGLFCPNAQLKGFISRRSPLIFAEAFKVSLVEQPPGTKHAPIDDRSFVIPLEQCSKATLFNMGLVHYQWGSPDTAMQFFDLASSLSQQTDALAFDPVVLGCLNNMAQIHLQYGRPNDAMELLSDAVTRGNAALARMYGDDHEDDLRCTRRLRRKLARTVMNMGHVHYYKCGYDAALAACNDALMLLYTNREDMEVAAAWYNTALVLHHEGNKTEALEYFDMFLDLAKKINGPNHIQLAEALHRKGLIQFEMGNLYDCMAPLNEALRIRRLALQENHPSIAESLCLIGKVLEEREEFDFALNALEQGLAVQRALAGDDLSFEVAQTLLEVGRAHHAQGHLEESLRDYLEVADITRRFFGERHPFVARIDNIVGNLYLEKGDLDESLKHFEEAMKIHLEQGLSMDMRVVQDPLLRVNIPRNPAAATA
jgi:tetratricopeptide (TPR) repeat protein